MRNAACDQRITGNGQITVANVNITTIACDTTFNNTTRDLEGIILVSTQVDVAACGNLRFRNRLTAGDFTTGHGEV